MKIAILQLTPVLGDRNANFENASNLLEAAMQNRPDVLVLPELWDIGFFPENALALGDVEGVAATDFLSRQARKHNVNIVGGSVVLRRGDVIWNRSYVFDRQGECAGIYDKTHLFSPSGENCIFQAGDAATLYEIDNVKASTIICYDIRFGDLARNTALSGAEVLFVPAAWPLQRVAHWRLLVQARAVENQFFVIAANCAGKAGQQSFCGHSMIVDPWGEILAEAGEEQQVLFAECDLAAVTKVRQRINIVADRRPALYEAEVQVYPCGTLH